MRFQVGAIGLEERDTTEALRVEILRVLDRGGRYDRRNGPLAALRACASEYPEVLIDLWDDQTEVQRRLYAFGRRLDIAMFGLKTDMDDQDFHQFLGLVHEHYRGALSVAASEQAARLVAHGAKGLEYTLNVLRESWEVRDLSKEVRELRLVGASILLQDELFQGERRVPRPVRIALSRLLKDTWMATRLGERFLIDVLRPIGSGEDLLTLIVSLDDIDRADLRSDLLSTLWHANRGDRELLTHMRQLLGDGLMTVRDMPTDVQGLLAREQRGAWCREKPGEFVAAMDAMSDEDIYSDNLRVLIGALPDLARQYGTDEIDRLARVIDRHAFPTEDFPERPIIVETMLTGLEGLDLATPIVGLYTSGDSDTRSAMGRLFESMGDPARALLLRVLSDTDRPAVCLDAALLLQKMTAPNWIVEHLTQYKPRPRAAVYLLKILSEIGGVQHAIALKPWLRHGDKDVRDAAIETAFLLGEARALPVLLLAIYDPEASIVIRAMRYLERLDYRDDRYIKHLAKLMTGESKGTEPGRKVPEQVRVAAMETLTRLGTTDLPAQGSFEEALLSLLPEPHKWKLIWRPPEPSTPALVRQAAVDALGRIGGTAALERLKNDSGETNGLIKSRMARAAGEVVRRVLRAG